MLGCRRAGWSRISDLSSRFPDGARRSPARRMTSECGSGSAVRQGHGARTCEERVGGLEWSCWRAGGGVHSGTLGDQPSTACSHRHSQSYADACARRARRLRDRRPGAGRAAFREGLPQVVVAFHAQHSVQSAVKRRATPCLPARWRCRASSSRRRVLTTRTVALISCPEREKSTRLASGHARWFTRQAVGGRG